MKDLQLGRVHLLKEIRVDYAKVIFPGGGGPHHCAPGLVRSCELWPERRMDYYWTDASIVSGWCAAERVETVLERGAAGSRRAR